MKLPNTQRFQDHFNGYLLPLIWGFTLEAMYYARNYERDWQNALTVINIPQNLGAKKREVQFVAEVCPFSCNVNL